MKWFSGAERPAELLPIRSCLARTQGSCLGNVRGSTLADLATAICELPAVRQVPGIEQLHVWEPDRMAPGQRGYEPGPTPLAGELDAAIRAVGAASWSAKPADSAPRLGGLVLDVIMVAPESCWVGWHQVRRVTDRWPGGVLPVTVPERAPSRAYGKLLEALRWSRLPLRAGDRCVEIGCAPGGSSLALLDLGAEVLGIDPAEVAAPVREHPRFTHVRKRGRDVRRRVFSGKEWLFTDMNVAPSYTLDTVESIATHPDVHFRGLMMTLKIPDWKLVDEIPQYVERVRGWGFRDVRTRQLARAGREICVVGLRSRGQRRIRRGRNVVPRRPVAEGS